MTDLWTRVDHLIDTLPQTDIVGLRAHGIQLLAGRHWRAQGRQIPPEFLADERVMVASTLTVPVLLERIRDILEGPIVLLKGPEVAARYPDPALRPFWDLDLLVQDAPAAQAALLAAGFEVVGSHDFSHQEVAIRWPGLHPAIEIHNMPNWPYWLKPPSTEALFAVAVPSVMNIEGVLTLPPREHALLLAAHSWHHGPLRSLQDLIDVAIMADEADPADLDALARRWGMHRVWTLTTRTIDIILRSDRPSAENWSGPYWAQHLAVARDRTVFQHHALRVLGAMAAPNPRAMLRGFTAAADEVLTPLNGESWLTKLARMRRALSDASRPSTLRGLRDTQRGKRSGSVLAETPVPPRAVEREPEYPGGNG